MQYQSFINSIEQDSCPEGIEPCLQALWYDANASWDIAHEIVQGLHNVMAARIHAYLHRKEGNDSNSRYWHEQAGTVFPEGVSLEEEWQSLAHELTE